VSCTSAELPDATKQTKNRARLLLATPQCRLTFMVDLIKNNFHSPERIGGNPLITNLRDSIDSFSVEAAIYNCFFVLHNIPFKCFIYTYVHSHRINATARLYQHILGVYGRVSVFVNLMFLCLPQNPHPVAHWNVVSDPVAC